MRLKYASLWYWRSYIPKTIIPSTLSSLFFGAKAILGLISIVPSVSQHFAISYFIWLVISLYKDILITICSEQFFYEIYWCIPITVHKDRVTKTYLVSHKKKVTFFKPVYFRPLVSLRKSSVLEMNLWISSNSKFSKFLFL